MAALVPIVQAVATVASAGLSIAQSAGAFGKNKDHSYERIMYAQQRAEKKSLNKQKAEMAEEKRRRAIFLAQRGAGRGGSILGGGAGITDPANTAKATLGA